MIVSGVIIIVAVIMFSLMRGGNSSAGSPSAGSPVTMWGVVSEQDFVEVVSLLQQDGTDITNIQYFEKDLNTFENDFLKALAEGTGPDIIMIPQDFIVANEKRLTVIPYDSYPLRDFRDTFIEEGELYATKEGIIALPFVLDPLVMYWNRTSFSQNGISAPPSFWDQVMQITPRLTIKDSTLNIEKSAVALGEFRNLDHAKEIFLTLVLQAGNPVIVRDHDLIAQSEYKVILSERLGFTVAPVQAAINFFTQFANPAKDIYSWNRSLPRSQDRFVAGDLAMYFGFASEADDIREKNPNLNFDVAPIPQSRNGELRKTFGKMTGLAISRNAKNTLGAFETINILTSREVIEVLNEVTGLPPVRRDLLQPDPSDPYETVFFTSALWADGILDINKSESEKILQSMIESVSTGRLGVSEAVSRAENEIIQLLGNSEE